MMKIERQLSISQDKKGNDIGKVQDLKKDQIKNLKESHEDKFKKTKSQRDESRLETDVYIILKDDFDEIENRMTEYTSKIQSLEDVIEDKDKTIKKLQDDLSAIAEDNQKRIDKIKDDYSAKIDELNETIHNKDLEIEKTKTEYEEKIGNLKESHQKEINNLKLFDEDSHMTKLDHTKEINGIKDKIVIETIQYNDRINDLDNNLRPLKYIKGDYKPIIKELKEGIEHLKYIAQYSETQEEQIVQDIKKE